MELVCPAGNLEKLKYAYAYGADTAYIGLKKFSLRVKADNFYEDEYKEVEALKAKYPGKRLFCALNIAFHNREIDAFLANLDYFKSYPFDAFIVQDIGMVPILQKHFPGVHLHLSTQASCMNREAAKMYQSMGFKRVVLGREASLKEIREIKDACPDLELECFGHGAMCIAYSGRCLMSAYLTGRSAQSGFCSQPCRWEYDLGIENGGLKIENYDKLTAADAKLIAQSGILRLQERQRPGELFPVFEGDDFTAVLSSKDLCMIEHLEDMKKAGVDAIKVEGRMKSVYYVAMVARAYRKAIDAMEGKIPADEADPFIKSLYEVAHRQCTTGFYYAATDADKTTVGASDSPYLLAATIERKLSDKEVEDAFMAGTKKMLDRQAELEAMHPQARAAAERDEELHPEKKLRIVEKKAGWKVYEYKALNKTDAGSELEFVSPSVLSRKVLASEYEFMNPLTGEKLDWVNADHDCAIYTPLEIENGTLIRQKDPDFVEGQIRDTGR